jgi:hypothetical protein
VHGPKTEYKYEPFYVYVTCGKTTSTVSYSALNQDLSLLPDYIQFFQNAPAFGVWPTKLKKKWQLTVTGTLTANGLRTQRPLTLTVEGNFGPPTFTGDKIDNIVLVYSMVLKNLHSIQLPTITDPDGDRY